MIIILQDSGEKKQTAPCHLQDCDMKCRGSVCRGLREKRWIGAVLKGLCPELLFFFLLPWSKASFQNTLTATAPAPPNV